MLNINDYACYSPTEFVEAAPTGPGVIARPENAVSVSRPRWKPSLSTDKKNDKGPRTKVPRND